MKKIIVLIAFLLITINCFSKCNFKAIINYRDVGAQKIELILIHEKTGTQYYNAVNDSNEIIIENIKEGNYNILFKINDIEQSLIKINITAEKSSFEIFLDKVELVLKETHYRIIRYKKETII